MRVAFERLQITLTPALSPRRGSQPSVYFLNVTIALPPPHKQFIQIMQRKLIPRRSAVIALAAALGGFHVA
jgi:hypothetical protein